MIGETGLAMDTEYDTFSRQYKKFKEFPFSAHPAPPRREICAYSKKE